MRKLKLFIILLLLIPGFLKAQWIEKDSGSTDSFTDVVMLDNKTAIVVGVSRSILRTTDAGDTWTDISKPLSFVEPWYGLSFFDKDNGAVAGIHGSVMTTTNGGLNWIPHTIGHDQTCLSALQLTPALIYVGTDSGWVFKTLDSGKTWTGEKISEGKIRSLFAWRGAYVMGLPIYALTQYSICTKYEFPSGTWTEKIIPYFLALGSEAYYGEYAYGGGPGFIVGVFGDLRAQPAILRKQMADTSWQFVSTGLLGDGIYKGVSAPSENVAYVCGSTGMVVKTTDAGDTWKSIDVPSKTILNSIYFFDEDHGFAVGDSGKIFYTSNGVITGVNNPEEKIPTNFSLKQNYPNPFNPETTIEFSIPGRETNSSALSTTLKIYDILGNEITTLVSADLSAGNYFVKWNAGNYPSGIYFYRIQAGSFSQTKKLMLLK